MRVIRMFVCLAILTGVIYPLLMTLLAQVAMPHKANGSFVEAQGKIIGSSLIAQKFTGDKYFWPRPSAGDYNPLASGGSNLGPTSAALKKIVEQRHADNKPSDLIYASGSGLDPHITPAAAYYQINRVAQSRGMDSQAVKTLIDSHIEGRLFGAPCVNVLLLNLALDGR